MYTNVNHQISSHLILARPRARRSPNLYDCDALANTETDTMDHLLIHLGASTIAHLVTQRNFKCTLPLGFNSPLSHHTIKLSIVHH